MIICEDEVKIQTPDHQYTIEVNVNLIVNKLIKKNEQPIRPFSVRYTFHENKIDKEIYSTWGQDLKMTPIRSRVDATFTIAKMQNNKEMTLERKTSEEMKVNIDEKGQFIKRFLVSEVESAEETTSTHFEEITDNEGENTEIQMQKTPQKETIIETPIKATETSTKDTKCKLIVNITLNRKPRKVKRKKSYREDSDESQSESEKGNRRPTKKMDKAKVNKSVIKDIKKVIKTIFVPPERVISVTPGGITKMAGVIRSTGAETPRVVLHRVKRRMYRIRRRHR